MLFLLGSVLYRAGAGWHGNAIIKLMRSGGISDEDALNRPFPFVLVVNNPSESNS